MKPTKPSLVLQPSARSNDQAPVGGSLLLSFEQLNNGRISAEILNSGVLQIRGAIDHLRWHDLVVVAETVKTALVRIDLAPSEVLSLVPRIDFFEGQTITAYDLWFDSGQSCLPDLSKVQNVAQSVLSGITEGKEILNDGLFEPLGGSLEVSVLNSLIKETRTVSGGRKFSSLIEVTSGDWKVRLPQKLARKPDLSDHCVVPVELTGNFVGVQTEKFELYFFDGEKHYVLNYSTDQIAGNKVGEAIFNATKCKVRAHKTIDRKGEPIYGYLPDAPYRSKTYGASFQNCYADDSN